MSTILHLPNPPYYAVIAPAALGPDLDGYPETAQHAMATAAEEMDGYLGIEYGFQPGFALAVSFWRSLDAIDTWRHHPTHQHAKSQGKSRWFTGYATRIAQVIEHY